MTDSSDLKMADEPMDGDDKQACTPKPYGPITQGLRDLMVESNQWLFGQTGRGHKTLSCSMQRFIEACNAIDAVHKALEDENAKLRKELKERPIAGDSEVMAFVERLGDAVEKFEDLELWGVDYVAYPVGCDMRTIRPMCKVDGYGRTHTVMQLILNSDGSWSLVNDRGDTYHDMAAFAHHQPDVKDTLLEMIGELMSTPMNKLRADELAEKYAKNFTLAEDCEDGDDDE